MLYPGCATPTPWHYLKRNPTLSQALRSCVRVHVAVGFAGRARGEALALRTQDAIAQCNFGILEISILETDALEIATHFGMALLGHHRIQQHISIVNELGYTITLTSWAIDGCPSYEH